MLIILLNLSLAFLLLVFLAWIYLPVSYICPVLRLAVEDTSIGPTRNHYVVLFWARLKLLLRPHPCIALSIGYHMGFSVAIAAEHDFLIEFSFAASNKKWPSCSYFSVGSDFSRGPNSTQECEVVGIISRWSEWRRWCGESLEKSVNAYYIVCGLRRRASFCMICVRT